MPVRNRKELRQFICYDCPGKDPSRHRYHVWHEWVQPYDLESECNKCGEMVDAVDRGEEEGVHICNFDCSCGNEFVVQCTMQDTAPCYACGAAKVSPHSFQPLRRIRRKTDNVHNCSKCHGRGNCPNLRVGLPRY